MKLTAERESLGMNNKRLRIVLRGLSSSAIIVRRINIITPAVNAEIDSLIHHKQKSSI